MRRVPVEVYSRVTGYFRPVGQWNPGKQEEFKERTNRTVTEELIKKGGKNDRDKGREAS